MFYRIELKTISTEMADYIISNEFKTMEEMWDDLLRLHWDYLDTEENMEKLKMRRKLEGWKIFTLEYL